MIVLVIVSEDGDGAGDSVCDDEEEEDDGGITRIVWHSRTSSCETTAALSCPIGN